MPAAASGEFGNLLRGHRRNAGLSQEELAERSGLSVRTIANMERGRTARPYRRSVGALADALGLGGPERAELDQASRRMAAGPGSRAAEHPGRPGGASPWLVVIPHQLPAAVPHFAGRASELAALDELLGPGGTVVISAISGTAGVGKTALAVYWSQQNAARFLDGQLYLNLRGFDPSGMPMEPIDAIRSLLDALGVPAPQVPANTAALEGLYRSVLAGKRMLILLDNARDAAQVRPLLPGDGACLVIITSRNQLAGLVAAEGARPLTLDLLDDSEARELLTVRLGATRLDAEPEAVMEVTSLCARLPLALAIVAGLAVLRPQLRMTELAHDLRDARRTLNTLDAGDTITSARAVFSWSVDRLPDPAARMFRLLGLHPGPEFSVQAAASLAAIPPDEAGRLLTELAGAHLLAERARARFSFHDLLRTYAAEQAQLLESQTHRREAIGRLLTYYVEAGHAAAMLVNPIRAAPGVPLPVPPPGTAAAVLADRAAAMVWYETEYPALLAAADLAAESGLDSHAWLISWSLSDFFDRRCNYHEWAVTQRTALAAAGRLGDRALQARAARSLGRACTELGALQDAQTYLLLGLELERQLGNRDGEARTHLALCQVLQYGAHYADAIDHARQALTLYAGMGDRTRQAIALNGIGWFHAQEGRYQEALAACEEALRLNLLTADRRGEAVTRDSLGFIHHQLGNFCEAVKYFESGLEALGDVDDHNAADILIHLGDAYCATRSDRRAKATWQRALRILVNLDLPDAAESVRVKLSQLGSGADTRPS